MPEKIYIPLQQHSIQADLYGDFSASTQDVIVMSHGLGGEKQLGLADFAEQYQQWGYRVCVFDHRGFGESRGAVPQLVDKNSQLKDWQTVIHYLKQHYGVQHSQLILWGYSFSGAHVLTLASESYFKAVIANFPHADGLASLALYPKKYLLPASFKALQDLIYAPFGHVKTMPVVAENRFAILAGADSFQGYTDLIPHDVHWHNAVPARIVATIGFYRPTQVAHKISNPTLVVGAQQDSLIPIKATRKMAKKIPQGQYIELDCGHFDLFDPVFKSQLLRQHHSFLAAL